LSSSGERIFNISVEYDHTALGNTYTTHYQFTYKRAGKGFDLYYKGRTCKIMLGLSRFTFEQTRFQMAIRRRQSGFTLIELLVVVAIVGILSAIAVWAYQKGMIRARQKRTMADMRTIAVAWEARALDQKQYNAAGFSMPGNVVSYPQVVTLIAPDYLKIVPRIDGFGFEYQFALDQTIGGGAEATEYSIRSPGKDGVFDPSMIIGGTTNPDNDIIYSGGAFISYPSGLQ